MEGPARTVKQVCNKPRPCGHVHGWMIISPDDRLLIQISLTSTSDDRTDRCQQTRCRRHGVWCKRHGVRGRWPSPGLLVAAPQGAADERALASDLSSAAARVSAFMAVIYAASMCIMSCPSFFRAAKISERRAHLPRLSLGLGTIILCGSVHETVSLHSGRLMEH